MKEMITQELKLESGGDYYYLFTNIAYFYDPHGYPDKGGIEKKVVKTKYKLPEELLNCELNLDKWSEEFTKDNLAACIVDGDDESIRDFIDGYKDEIGIGDYTEEEMADYYLLDELTFWSDDDTYGQDGYNCRVVMTSIRELKDESEAINMTEIIKAYNLL